MRSSICLLVCVFGTPLWAQSTVPSAEEVLHQQRPESWPESVDVEMDEEILSDENLKKAFIRSLSQAPSLLLEISVEDLFGKAGIHQDIVVGMEVPEVQAKASYWPSREKGFTIRCGISPLRDGIRTQSPKRSFHLRFGGKYGEEPLSCPLFSEQVEKFENLLIRNPTPDFWMGKRGDDETANARYVNDRWALETARSLGHLAPRQKWVHVYVNRIYWGIYALSERPDTDFGSSYRGTEAKDLDVFYASELREGSEDQRKIAENFLSHEFKNTPEAFQRLEEIVDLPSLMDHLICQMYQGKRNWPDRNYFLIGSRADASRFEFVPWNSEIGFYEKFTTEEGGETSALYFSPLSSTRFRSDRRGPGFWYRNLSQSAEFRLMMADRFHFLISENGVLSPRKAAERYRSLVKEVAPFLLPEALRWGNAQRQPPYNPYGEEWDKLTEDDSWLFTRFFPLRPVALKKHLRDEKIWPSLEPPTFFTRVGRSRESKFYLKNTNTLGIIVYTLDGSDPREKWTGKPRGKAFRESLKLPSGTQVKARVFRNQTWSALMTCDVP